jgi:Pao retrotransposon peptidase/Integrase zinc binding domain
MKPGACFTCLGYRQGCGINGCVNAATTPQDVLCQDCFGNQRLQREPPNVLLCGLSHFKPTPQELIPRFENWITGFSAQGLGTPISVNLARAPQRLEEMDNELSLELYPEPEKNIIYEGRPPNRETEIIYDTSTGQARPVDPKKDIIVKTSDESVGYVMQLLYFGDQKVLTFYDSGANQNIVQAKLARDAGFLQLSSKPVAIGVAGGGEIITNHGQYMAVLGPCQDGKSYSLDCQAVAQITRHFPLVKLDPVIDEARDSLPPETLFPAETGGDEVKLLVGIRQTELAPRLITSLPSGVSIFESKVTDVFGSNICFGGPHQVFTEAYRTLGINFQVSSIQSLQALFTEVATAYIESPWAFIREEEKIPYDRKMLLESRDPDTANFTPAMVELALEIAPELVLYQAEEGEPIDLGEKLNSTISNDESDNVAFIGRQELFQSTRQRIVTAHIIDEVGQTGEIGSFDSMEIANDATSKQKKITNPQVNQETWNQTGVIGSFDSTEVATTATSEQKKMTNPQVGQDIQNDSQSLLDILMTADGTGCDHSELDKDHINCYHASDCETPHSCYKALIPLSKLKGLVDEMDIPDVTDFRCDVCSNCTVCRMSARLKTKSLQESFEQEVIEKSVRLDSDNDQVVVTLPFIKDPVPYLTNKHGGPDNKKQALSVYRSQCMKSPEVKEQLRKTHKDLVDQGFMQNISELDPEKQSLIHKADFRHFYLWRAVFKESSASTPVRIVVDPTATGLNCILAKGSNMLGRIPEVLLNFRANSVAWCSDISKMYNRLKLDDSALPYSLFLWHDSLDPNTPPETFVMSAAWYGVSSTGNQANVAVDRLWELHAEEFPKAVNPLSKDRYMDDVDSGADSREEVDEQVKQVTECLRRGGFATKFVAHSGEPPPEKATVDGVSVGVLGMKWRTEEDTLGLNFSPMNLEKKVRGAKKTAKVDVTTPEGIRTAFQKNLMTRAAILGRVSEFYDPAGWFEPLKLQMKLHLTTLNGLDWSTPAPAEDAEPWVELFTLMEGAREVRIPRCVKPQGTRDKMRLLCISDASDRAGGCAIYGGFQLPDGTYSCTLLCARSRLMRNSVPRNELEAILLCAETSLMVQAGLQGRVEEVHYFSDSSIAICWVLNTQKRLRMWAHNRVKEIRNAIKWVSSGEEKIPLYYIQSQQNIADLLTKPFTLTTDSIGPDSLWQTGLNWMSEATPDLPKYQPTGISNPDEVEGFEQELFPDCFTAMVEDRELLMSNPYLDQHRPNTTRLFEDETNCLLQGKTNCLLQGKTNCPLQDKGDGEVLSAHVANSNEFTKSWLTQKVDFERLGWSKARKVVALVYRFTETLLHRIHQKKKVNREGCCMCTTLPDSVLNIRVSDLIEKSASKEAELNIGKSKLEKDYTYRNEVWHSHTRLQKEGLPEIRDLDSKVFFDASSIRRVLPIMLVESPLFKSFLKHVHDNEMAHPGVEPTLKRIRESFAPMGGQNVRAVITAYRRNCTKCRRNVKLMVEKELADFPVFRTSVAPPFYFVMADIAMAFKARSSKDSRKTSTAHALVLVCLVTSSTNILVLDGLSTQAVTQALERHAARYGMPAILYVDPGTQLVKLRDASFDLHDVHQQYFQHMKFDVFTSAPKAHQSQGRVERRIRLVRDMLQRLFDTTDQCNTLLGWETVFARIASQIDDVPIARGTSTAPTDLGWDIITPNRLKLGRNNFRQLEGEVILNSCPQSQLDRNRSIMKEWYVIFIDRVHLLVPGHEKEKGRQTLVNDIVLFVFSGEGTRGSSIWKLGRVMEIKSGTTILIQYSHAGVAPKTILRSIRQTVLILGADELNTSQE